jgi:hypothetical protein
MKNKILKQLVNSAIPKIGGELSASEMNEVMGGGTLGLVICCNGVVAEDVKTVSLFATKTTPLSATETVAREIY